jgi:putative SOS response-associated peptidase YedK
MCGRFVRSSSLRKICEYFDVKHPSFEIEPSYNIAPSQNVLIISNPGARQLASCRWGFMPCWAKDLSVGYKMINARAESVTEKPAFKTAFRKHGCLVIANSFYEWQKDHISHTVISRKLALLNVAGRIEDLRVPPGNRLEALKGKRQGQWSVRINDRWRICFRFEAGNAFDVEIVDYH